MAGALLAAILAAPVWAQGAPDAPQAAADLALSFRDSGNPIEAAEQWSLATRLSGGDAFLWSRRGFNALALERFPEALDCFRRSIAVSSGPAEAAEARLGMGMADAAAGRPPAAFPALQAAAAGNPFLAAAAAQELGRLAALQGRLAEAVPFYSTALSQDPMMRDALLELARVLERIGRPLAAWQALGEALRFDPGDGSVAAAMRSLDDRLADRPQDSLPWRRMGRTLMGDPAKTGEEPFPKSRRLRALLFAEEGGGPAALRRFFFSASCPFRLADSSPGGEAPSGPANTQWEVLSLPGSGILEVRDAAGDVRFATEGPFRIEPLRDWGTVLVKSPEPALRRGQGADDRELRGALEVEPAPGGFILVNETGVEEYLASVLPGALAPGSPPEALKSLAVLLRSLVAEALSRPPSHAGGSPLCDSPHCRPYEGLARESSSTSRAVRETAGTVLRGGARLEFHADRGFSPAAGLSPSALERRLRPSAQARASRWNRWVRVLEGSSLRANAERLGRTGALKGVRVLRRGPDGRVEAMEVRGRGGSLALEGERDIAAFLSPGSLRSTLFSIEPLYRNGELRRIILWGAGTGHGRGLDAASASAQAERGLSFAEILSGAFPGSRLSGANGEAR